MSDKSSTRKPKIEITVTQEEKEFINQCANEENLKAATLCRKIILDYIKSKKQK